MKKWLLVLSIISFNASAADLCFKSENNPRTGEVFQTQADYDDELSLWNQKHPGMPNPFSLMKAYSLYSSEKDLANKLKKKSDKLAHCYVGCRISQEISKRTADYVGWYKEEKDLKDCHHGTRFDEQDYIATVRGADLGETQQDAKGCLDSCTQIYSR
ncbi:hypothetical protein [Bdellovibrio reynosensis]|uniref:Uncharacterized protein n=1 Tax=Bdellovibrio reynosensis TaxID=2835041 RepID=A0ABY4C9X6_9BACT|nr:hypothetical protein [Bdellovibrio reynosensis]UOF01710.1 hypothetical protein MNR06_01920 [Bdellovibrio reynosensis]